MTSPYNSMLTLGALTEHADCVLPLENQVHWAVRVRVLYVEYVRRPSVCCVGPRRDRREAKQGCWTQQGSQGRRQALGLYEWRGSATNGESDSRNAVQCMSAWKVSKVSIRFPGSLNVDLNEISMNLVPFPRYDVRCCSCRLTCWG